MWWDAAPEDLIPEASSSLNAARDFGKLDHETAAKFAFLVDELLAWAEKLIRVHCNQTEVQLARYLSTTLCQVLILESLTTTFSQICVQQSRCWTPFLSWYPILVRASNFSIGTGLCWPTGRRVPCSNSWPPSLQIRRDLRGTHWPPSHSQGHHFILHEIGCAEPVCGGTIGNQDCERDSKRPFKKRNMEW